MEKLDISEVYKAAEVLQNVARHPKLIGVTKINPEAQVYLKPENLQYTGSFKLREPTTRSRSSAMKKNRAALSPARPATMPRAWRSAPPITA